MTTTPALPHWDMTPIFPSLTSLEFDQAFQAALKATRELADLFDNHQVSRVENAPTIDAAFANTFDTIVRAYNTVLGQLDTLGTYILCFVDVNSQDTLAQAKYSELQQATVLLSQLDKRFVAWIGSLPLDALLAASEEARKHEFYLQRAHFRSQYLMSPAEEALASELHVSGGTAWGMLHSNITSQTTVQANITGEEQKYTLVELRNFIAHEDRETRKRAQEIELTGWHSVSETLAASINSIKQETLVLNRRRGWESPLAWTLFYNAIDQKTLDAMMSSAREAFPIFRTYMRAKAHVLGNEKLAWYDLMAPSSKSERVWSYGDATRFIVQQFGKYSDRLATFAQRAFNENWIDAESRPGKVGGAYCAQIRPGESRILSNFTPSFDGITTLAHELGHAYHNLNLKDRTPLQATLPMTLAETASIFCETIVRNGALQEADDLETLAILEAYLQSANQVVVDITSRFLFESGVLEKRKQRNLSVQELNDLMLATQRETYGDAMEEATLHPYMWAVKGHYYSSGLPFYNYPYMFGLLFGLGLYAQYEMNPESFKARYDDLLSSTGLADAATLAKGFGFDLQSKAFWQGSLEILQKDIQRYSDLAHKLVP